jgi:hypothetical protein
MRGEIAKLRLLLFENRIRSEREKLPRRALG